MDSPAAWKAFGSKLTFSAMLFKAPFKQSPKFSLRKISFGWFAFHSERWIRQLVLSDLKTPTSIGCRRWVALGSKAIRIMPCSRQNRLSCRLMCDACPSRNSTTGVGIFCSINHGRKCSDMYLKNESLVIHPLSDCPITNRLLRVESVMASGVRR